LFLSIVRLLFLISLQCISPSLEFPLLYFDVADYLQQALSLHKETPKGRQAEINADICFFALSLPASDANRVESSVGFANPSRNAPNPHGMRLTLTECA
jgi:hypothetical protein